MGKCGSDGVVFFGLPVWYKSRQVRAVRVYEGFVMH